MRLAAGVALVALLATGCANPGSNDSKDSEVVATNEGGRDHFEPATLRVTAGTTVTFRDERGSHTVDFQQARGVSAPHSGNLDPGMTHAVRFDQAGTFHFYCAYHSSQDATGRTGMVGAIEVI